MSVLRRHLEPVRSARAVAGPVAQLSAWTVLVGSVFMAAMDVVRIAVFAEAADARVAAAFTLAYLPLHQWHLRFGLRGERPPHATASLAALALVHVAAVVVLGTAWMYSLSALCVSALIVLRAGWALALVAACAALPPLLADLRPDIAVAMGANVAYLSLSVVFRTVTLYALVWVVAAMHSLARSRAAHAEQAVARERERVEAGLRATLQRDAADLLAAGRQARAGLDAPGVAPALVALDRVLQGARDSLGRVRRLVAETRAGTVDAQTAGAARSSRAPVIAGLRRLGPLRIAVVVHVVILGYVPAANLGLFGTGATTPLPVTVALAGAVVGIQCWISAAVIRGRRPRAGTALWLALVGLTVAGGALNPAGWDLFGWTVVASAAMLFTGRRLRAAGALIVGLAVADYVRLLDAAGAMPAAELVWTSAYYVWSYVFIPAALLAATTVVGAIERLERSNAALARAAADAERRRLSSDLHDVLGQTLTAVSLKADLAKRLLRDDPARSRAEIDELLALVGGQQQELQAVAQAERAVSLAGEARNAVALLEAAGVTVDARLALADLDAETSALLGWAVREATTNVLRHADAGSCGLRAWRGADGLHLEVVNDGVAAAPAGGAGGHGLPGLRERLAERGGELYAGALPHGRHRLLVRLPAAVPTQSLGSM